MRYNVIVANEVSVSARAIVFICDICTIQTSATRTIQMNAMFYAMLSLYLSVSLL